MTSFQISLTPSRRAAARFISSVRRTLLKALAEEKAKNGTTQSEVARAIDVHRSVISRELHGRADISLGRLAELAWALGREPVLELREDVKSAGRNRPQLTSGCVINRTETKGLDQAIRIVGSAVAETRTPQTFELVEG